MGNLNMTNEMKLKDGVISGLLEICNDHILNCMIQPYAGANAECLFCGCSDSKHNSDCSVTIYRDFVKKQY